MQAYFIGGSQDLTKRVVESAPKYYEVPVMGHAPVSRVGSEAVFNSAITIETYRLVMRGEDLAVYHIDSARVPTIIGIR